MMILSFVLRKELMHFALNYFSSDVQNICLLGFIEQEKKIIIVLLT